MAEIRVPALGESVTEATIGKWFKHPGDAVAVDEPLVELETDKVTIEVPAPAAGVLSGIAAKDGDTVAVGAVLGEIKEGAGGAAGGATGVVGAAGRTSCFGAISSGPAPIARGRSVFWSGRPVGTAPAP
ncbi:MAG: dihydrolipoamide succinyltransferase, partial [Hyphomicrobiales bacterium]|nr:dihydrolipoamide succinyltransferase [Hyphomicrobiales bacterium]